jgi:hypothetical protein
MYMARYPGVPDQDIQGITLEKGKPMQGIPLTRLIV